MTCAKRATKMCRELMRLKVPFKVGADGYPIVMIRAVEAVFIGGTSRRNGPNLNAMEELRVKTESRKQRSS
jgi:hypothetical protein